MNIKMENFPVDVVYMWVDGKEEKWISKKDKLLNKLGNYYKTSDIIGEKRFKDNQELKYSIRSVEKFCPWVRKIFIVTDDQKPSWLNSNKSNLKIIDHRDLFDDSNCLPTFNSNAIEMRLHHINGLSNSFLSFNDDFFIGRPSLKSDFFHNDGSPKLYMSKSVSKIKLRFRLKYPFFKRLNAHAFALLNSRKLIYDKYHLLINQSLMHSVKSLNKNILYEIEGVFSNECKQTSQNQLRDPSDIWMISLHAYYSIALKKVKLSKIKKIQKIDFINNIYTLLNIKLDYGFINLNWPLKKIEKYLFLIQKYSPLTFCLNDWNSKNPNLDIIVKKFLEKMYPNKSSYEQ